MWNITKTQLRETFLNMRLRDKSSSLKKASSLIQKRCLKILEELEPQTIALYFPFQNEVETKKIRSVSDGLSRKIVFPRRVSGERRLKFYELDEEMSLIKTKNGLMEPDPSKCEETPLEEVDLFILPGLAFDVQGYRLGYGFGYYDRTLCDVSRNSLVALAYEFQVVSSLPWADHDVNVNRILTESRMIECW